MIAWFCVWCVGGLRPLCLRLTLGYSLLIWGVCCFVVVYCGLDFGLNVGLIACLDLCFCVF